MVCSWPWSPALGLLAVAPLRQLRLLFADRLSPGGNAHRGRIALHNRFHAGPPTISPLNFATRRRPSASSISNGTPGGTWIVSSTPPMQTVKPLLCTSCAGWKFGPAMIAVTGILIVIFAGSSSWASAGRSSHRKRPPPCGQPGGGASMRSRNASGDISHVRPHRMEGSWPERHQIITVSCDTPSNSAASATRNPRRAVFSINKL